MVDFDSLRAAFRIVVAISPKDARAMVAAFQRDLNKATAKPKKERT